MASIRDSLLTSGNGQVMYLPAIDIRKELGMKPDELPPQNTNEKLALNKVVYIDHSRRTIYFYDKNGQLYEKPFEGTHKSTDQEIRAAMEIRVARAVDPEKGKKKVPPFAKLPDGTVVSFDHDKDGNHEHDFREGEFHPKPETVGDLMPTDKKADDPDEYDDDYFGGTPVFCYADNAKLKAYVDAWLSERDRAWDPKVESPLLQVDFLTARTYFGKCYVAMKAAQEVAKDYATLVKQYHETAKAFREAKVTDAPKVPHIHWKFFPHQARVLAMLDKVPYAMVGVAAGGGKTLLAAADILNYVAKKRVKRGCIVMPGDKLVAQQKQEIKEFTKNTVNVICLTSEIVGRYCQKTEDGRYDLEPLRKMIVTAPPNTIILATYSFFTQEKIKTATKGKFRFPRAYWLSVKCGVDMVNIDECHKIKNVSDTSESMLQLGELVKVRRAMSGTLVANNLKDIHRPGVFTDASILGDLDTFLERYASDYSTQGDRATVKAWKPGAAKAIRSRLMQTCGVQVGRSHWLYMLPKFQKRYHKVDLSPAQSAAYKRIVLDTMRELEGGVTILYDKNGKEIGTEPNPDLKKIWEKFQASREEDDDEEEDSINPMLLAKLSKFDQYVGCPLTDLFTRKALSKADQTSPKVKKLDEILDEHFALIPKMKKEVNEKAGTDKKKQWHENMGKVIVFSTFTDVAYHLSQLTKYRKQAVYYDAGHKDVLAQFKTDPKIKILFAVEQSMREGHNLQMANRTIRVNVPWNPGDIEQTKARTYRAGNIHPTAYEDVIICDGTAEVAKAARLICKMHNNAKLLSDFDDDLHQQPIFMNKDTLNDFTSYEGQLKPYLPLEESIQKFDEEDAERLSKINGKQKVEIGNGKTIEGSKTIRTPYVDGDDEATTHSPKKPESKAPTAKDPAPHGATTDMDVVIRSFWAGSNNVIVMSDTPNHPKLRRLGGSWEADMYVMRAEKQTTTLWILDALISLGIGVKNRTGEWETWVKKNLPKGLPVKDKLPGKEKKIKHGVHEIEAVTINGKNYVYVFADDITPAVKTAMKKINLAGDSFKLLKNAGYHFEDTNSKKKLFDLLRAYVGAGYGISNTEVFEKMVAKFYPGCEAGAMSIVGKPDEAEAEEEGSEEESEKPAKKKGKG